MADGVKITINKAQNQMTIVMPIDPKPSGSGKSMVIASTRGNQPTGVKFEGKELTLGVNCYHKI